MLWWEVFGRPALCQSKVHRRGWTYQILRWASGRFIYEALRSPRVLLRAQKQSTVNEVSVSIQVSSDKVAVCSRRYKVIIYTDVNTINPPRAPAGRFGNTELSCSVRDPKVWITVKYCRICCVSQKLIFYASVSRPVWQIIGSTYCKLHMHYIDILSVLLTWTIFDCLY